MKYLIGRTIFETEAVSRVNTEYNPIKHFPRRENCLTARTKEENGEEGEGWRGESRPTAEWHHKKAHVPSQARINKRGSSSRGQTRDIQVPAIN